MSTFEDTIKKAVEDRDIAPVVLIAGNGDGEWPPCSEKKK
jgi:1,4-dihydroxy-2-naphthoyl-CoA synthase